MSAVTLLAALSAPAASVAQQAATKARASEQQALPPSDGGTSPGVAEGMGGSLLRLGLGLIIVVGLILAVWYVLKRMQRGRMPGFAGGAVDLVDVVATTPLGPNRFLHLVRVGEELILVGATDQSITPVARIGGDDAVDLLQDTLDPATVRQAYASAQEHRPDPRVRASATAREASLVDRLRALTARR